MARNFEYPELAPPAPFASTQSSSKGGFPRDVEHGGRFDVGGPTVDPNQPVPGPSSNVGTEEPSDTPEGYGGGGGEEDDASFAPPVPDVPLSLPPVAPPSRSPNFSKIGPRPRPRGMRVGAGASSAGGEDVGVSEDERLKMVMGRLGMGQ